MLKSLVVVIVSFAFASFAGAQSQYVIMGTKSADVLIKNALAGEAVIAQRYDLAGTGVTGPNGETLRADDPADPIDPVFQSYWAEALRDTPVRMHGRKGADQFIIRTFISGKPAVVLRNADENGVIDWSGNGVAGENDFVHDHWVEFFGVVQIKDFNLASGDTIEVQGHTVALRSLVVHDGTTYVTVQSQQGNGGGAHDEDILGYIVFKDAVLTADDLTFTHTNDGVVETVDKFMELTLFNMWFSQWVRQHGYELKNK